MAISKHLKLFSFLFFSIIVTLKSTAQYKVGITVGINSYDVGADFFDSKSAISPEFGSHVSFIFDEKSEILVEAIVNLSKSEIEGAIYEEQIRTGTELFDLKSTSFQLGGYYNHNLIPNILSVFAGPTLNYSFGSKVKGDIDNRDVRFGSLEVNEIILEELNPFLFLTAGITVGKDNLRARIKYSYGLDNGFKDATFSGGALNSKSSMISFALMYSIELF